MDKKRPIVYITRDIERALGMEPGDGYIVVSNETPVGRAVKNLHPESVLLINDPRGALDTFDLMSVPAVAELIERHDANIVVFQNTARIERLATERGWRLVNPLAAMAQRVEEKVSQVNWLNDDGKLLPPHVVAPLKDITFEGKRFVLQFNHSHTGQGTFIIESAGQLDEFKAKFPERECRAVDFVSGPVFTINVVVADTILLGSTSYQITGIAPFTDLPFSTIGNDWKLPHALLSEGELGAIDDIAYAVGNRMKADGWRGLFGIDVVQDEKTREMFLLEINARQPASATFESKLQRRTGISPTLFATHLIALTTAESKNPGPNADADLPDALERISDGAQIVQRVTGTPRAADLPALAARGLSVTTYGNKAHNKELFRIQSNETIMKDHNILNAQGDFIRSCIK